MAKYAMATVAFGTKVQSFMARIFFVDQLEKVVLRLVVFRPFLSEVIVARVKSSSEEGIRCEFIYLAAVAQRVNGDGFW